MQQWIVPAVIGALSLLAVVLVLLLVRGRARTTRELREARAEAAALRAQVEEIERRLAEPAARPRIEAGYVITHLGEQEREPDESRAVVGAPRVDGTLFADLVLRETVVKTASLAHGLRRALAPETRNRIRFEVKREIRAARKRRRREMKDLAQQVRATERARLADEDAA
ncbi:hypothetical protein GCM10009844_18400 [Nocardioides koreensis]|uniref:Uncharacterized protein n=1 Tax=Nocardioides koreensis TaxID=433651 RepID=A0ABN2ZMM6_9ACTN